MHPLPHHRSRERRQKQEELDRTRKLGDAGADVDDVLAWVSRSRQTDGQRAAAAQAARVQRAADARRQGESEDEDEQVCCMLHWLAACVGGVARCPACEGGLSAAAPARPCQRPNPPLLWRRPQDAGMPSAAELAGAKVKHSAEELEEGETMILTLGELRWHAPAGVPAGLPWRASLQPALPAPNDPPTVLIQLARPLFCCN